MFSTGEILLVVFLNADRLDEDIAFHFFLEWLWLAEYSWKIELKNAAKFNRNYVWIH